MISTILADAEALCRQIAPQDLAGANLYIIPQSRLPVDFGGASICYGFTSPSLDLLLEPAIGPAWAGRGPCMVVNDTALREDTDPCDFEQAMRAVVIHELAHILERPTLYADRSGEHPDRIVFERLVMAELLTHEEPADRPPYHGHGSEFIRLCLHACERASVAGVYIPPTRVCAGYRYGLSHVMSYQAALGDEPERLAKLSFREIHRTTPPPEFTDVWLADLNAKPYTPLRETCS